MNAKRLLVACTFVLVALASSTVFLQAQSAGTPGTSPPMDLGTPARACSEASSFLSQPKLSEAIAKAQSDKKIGKEAARNPNAYLAQNGVNVPADMRVIMNPGGGSPAGKGIKIEVRCCPLVIIITINL